MTTVLLPADVPAIEPLDAKPTASTVTDSFRGAATSIADVSSWTSERGVPANWTGDASESADHAMTQFSKTTDVAAAALTKVSLACDDYVDDVRKLDHERDGLVEERTSINAAISTLSGRVNGAEEDDASALQGDADQLARRADALNARITAWRGRVAANEDRLIAVFNSVETAAGAQRAADDPSRPDVSALNAQLDKIKDDPKKVNAWWNGLTDAQREALKVDNPDVIGNTNGIPTDDRDESNRASVTRDIDYLKQLKSDGSISDDQQDLLTKAEKTKEALDQGMLVIDRSTGKPVDTNLLLYLPKALGGDGAVAVSYGNPDTADNTTVIVPGIMNDMKTIPGNAASALDLFNESQSVSPGSSVATIAWMGYNAPDFSPEGATGIPGDVVDIGMVTNEGFAEAGGHHLSAFVDGLRATDTGSASHLTVIGHSYGSTTVAHAAHDGLRADDIALVGSPGADGDVKSPADFHLGNNTSSFDGTGHVYVGSDNQDPVTWLGRDGTIGLGLDPSQQSFGAQRFDVGTGPSFHIGNIGQGLDNHTAYFDPGSKSLHNLADVTTGHRPDIIDGRTQPANDYAKQFAEREAVHYGTEAAHAVVDPVVDAGVKVVATTGQVIDAGGKVLSSAVDTGGKILENTGRLLTPRIPTFGVHWP